MTTETPKPEPTWEAIESALKDGQRRLELLDHYATGTVQRFYQIDGFHGVEADSVFHPDENGECIFGSHVTELRHSGPEISVRVQIHETAEKAVAVRQLRYMADAIEQGFLDHDDDELPFA